MKIDRRQKEDFYGGSEGISEKNGVWNRVDSKRELKSLAKF